MVVGLVSSQGGQYEKKRKSVWGSILLFLKTTLISILGGFVRTLNRNTNVFSLILSECGQFSSEAR